MGNPRLGHRVVVPCDTISCDSVDGFPVDLDGINVDFVSLVDFIASSHKAFLPIEYRHISRP